MIYSETEDFKHLKPIPHSILLLGEHGIGKHELAQYICSDILYVSLVDITDDLNFNKINEIYSYPETQGYLIDCNKITEKEQNIILKFVEEPFETIYIFLIADSKNILLPTIINRCYKYEFKPYTYEDLKEAYPHTEEAILRYAHTPGQVEEYCNVDFFGIKQYCEKIVNCIKKASLPNILYVLPKYLAFESEQDKYPILITFRILAQCILERLYCDEMDVFYYTFYNKTQKLIQLLQINGIEKKMTIDNYFLDVYSCKGE